jgi:hypothetical protein
MPCREMKELETSLTKYAEKRQSLTAPNIERRKGSILGHRSRQARIACLMMMHRRTCTVCRSDC